MGLRRYGALGAALFFGFAGGAFALHEKSRLFHPSTDHSLYENIVIQQARRLERLNGGVVFLGDSLTSGLAISNINAPAENLGVPGDTVEGATARAAQYKLAKAGCIVVQIGVNNWPKDRFSSFLPKYRKLLDALPAGIPVLAVGIMPTNGNTKRINLPQFHLTEAIGRANILIHKACDERTNCTFLDMAPVLGEGGVLTPANDSGDGLHLSPAGYEKWEAALKADKCVSAHQQVAAT